MMITALQPERVASNSLKLLCAPMIENEWRLCSTTPRLKFPIYTKRFGASEGLLSVQSHSVLETNPENIYKIISNYSLWSSWDPDIKSAENIDNFSKNLDLLHVTLNRWAPLNRKMVGSKIMSRESSRARDLCVLWHKYESFRLFAVAIQSVDWYMCPARDGFIRATFQKSGFYITPVVGEDGHIDDNRTALHIVFHIDMSTRLPEFLAQFIIKAKCECLEKLESIISSKAAFQSPSSR